MFFHTLSPFRNYLSIIKQNADDNNVSLPSVLNGYPYFIRKGLKPQKVSRPRLDFEINFEYNCRRINQG
jgi:hypothetical protein